MQVNDPPEVGQPAPDFRLKGPGGSRSRFPSTAAAGTSCWSSTRWRSRRSARTSCPSCSGRWRGSGRSTPRCWASAWTRGTRTRSSRGSWACPSRCSRTSTARPAPPTACSSPSGATATARYFVVDKQGRIVWREIAPRPRRSRAPRTPWPPSRAWRDHGPGARPRRARASRPQATADAEGAPTVLVVDRESDATQGPRRLPARPGPRGGLVARRRGRPQRARLDARGLPGDRAARAAHRRHGRCCAGRASATPRSARCSSPRAPTPGKAVEAMRQGAADFQVKPLNHEKLLAVLRRGLERAGPGGARGRDGGPARRALRPRAPRPGTRAPSSG